jgi:divalent metal cation (Fe/Co/Zn/Cd) transporter
VMQGVERFSKPEPIENVMVALGVLGVSVLLESFSLYGAMKEIRKTSGGKPFFKWFRETRQSELLVVAGEDIAALCGLTLAFIAVLLAVVTGNPVWDAVGTIAVGVLLMVVAIFVMHEVKGMITGESAAPEVHAAIKAHILERPEVDRVIHLITVQWGAQLMVAVQARMHAQPSDHALVDAINTVEETIQQRWPQVKWCFFEPDFDPGRD